MNQLSKFISIFGLMLLALPSCKQHSSFKKTNVKKSNNSINLMQQLVAKYPDIPQPLNVQLIGQPQIQFLNRGDDQETSVKIEAASAQSAEMVRLAYEHEMERLGWQQMAEFQDDLEAVFIFNKPSRVCIISLRSGRFFTESTTSIVIRLGAKLS